MSVEIVGLDSAVREIDGLQKKLKTSVGRTLIKYSSDMALSAKRNHRFRSISNNLEGSIKTDVDGMEFSFYLDDRTTTVGNNRSYGVFQHEGTYNGYRKSKSAPRFRSSVGSPGIKADHFMDRAWDKYYKKMEKAIIKNIEDLI